MIQQDLQDRLACSLQNLNTVLAEVRAEGYNVMLKDSEMACFNTMTPNNDLFAVVTSQPVTVKPATEVAA